MKPVKNEVGENVVALDEKKRGRKEGQKVSSLDFRAFLALDEIDFAERAKDSDFGSKAWQRRQITDIIAKLRENDIF